MLPEERSNSCAVKNERNINGRFLATGEVAAHWKPRRKHEKVQIKAGGVPSATDAKKRTKEQKAAILLHVGGPEEIEVYNTSLFRENEKDYHNVVLSKFGDYCTPKRNEADIDIHVPCQEARRR